MVSMSRALALFLILPLLSAGSSLRAAAAVQETKPRIFTVEVSTRDFRAGQKVLGHVTTTFDVASVEARVGGYSSVLDKRGAGEFALNYTLPPAIPWFVHGTWTLKVIARTTDGVATTRELPVTLH
jgi:hypothetical protein